jgi:hypothetical protein
VLATIFHVINGGDFATKNVIASNLELVENILKIYRESYHKIKESPADAAVIGSEGFNVPENIFLKALLRDLDN